MKSFKRFLPLPVLALILAGSLTVVLADPITPSPGGNTIGTNPVWDGTTITEYIYLGTYTGTDDATAVQQVLADLGIPHSSALREIGSLDLNPFAADPGVGITIAGAGISGTWHYEGPGDVQFLVIRAGDAWALYQLTAPYEAGTELPWDTWDLPRNENGERQQINGYTIYGVPEPGTLLLLGAGLIGLRLIRRKLRT